MTNFLNEIEIKSVLVGEVKPLGERKAPSAIDKKPLTARSEYNEFGFLEDRQGDLEAHGGLEKALHHYPFDHYGYWRTVLSSEEGAYKGPSLGVAGAFGENISTKGVIESQVCLGDIFQLGTGVVQVSQGRQPCWKLNERFCEKQMSRSVQKTGRTGWYYRVLEDGSVGPGDRMVLKERLAPEWDLARVTHLLYVDTKNFADLEEMVQLSFLAESWRQLAERRLAKREVEDWSERLEG